MKFFIRAALVSSLIAASSLANAKGSSYVQSNQEVSSSGMIPWNVAQRVITWGSDRNWQTTAGVILVCPWNAKTSYNKDCKDSKDDRVDRWTPVTDYKIPGYEIVGFKYVVSPSTGFQQLMVFYGAVKPKQEVKSVEPSPITLPNPITIVTPKVVVQKKK